MTALAATAKEQASQIQKVSAQLKASKPAPQVVNNPKAAPQQSKQHFTISRHASPCGGFLFASLHHSLNSPACSCVSITLPSIIVNPNHRIM
jgi:hypothetical protein